MLRRLRESLGADRSRRLQPIRADKLTRFLDQRRNESVGNVHLVSSFALNAGHDQAYFGVVSVSTVIERSIPPLRLFRRRVQV
jgi:hypothetical protein